MTIPQTNIVSTIKQLINTVSHSESQFLQMCRNIRIKFLSWAYMYTTFRFLGKHMIQTNLSVFDERLFRPIFVQTMFQTRKRNTWFYILRQGIPEEHSSEGCASFKEVKPWPWHVEVIPGVGVVGLVTNISNKELCQVIWGITVRLLLDWTALASLTSAYIAL